MQVKQINSHINVQSSPVASFLSSDSLC